MISQKGRELKKKEKKKKKKRKERENESQVRLPCEVPAKSGVCKPWPKPGNFTIVTRSNGSVARAQGLDKGPVRSFAIEGEEDRER